jgi:GR25 family glycosyltransferase involved in LPS biosynthesis
MKIKCYVLTLENSERHKHMIEKMSKFNGLLDYEFVFGRTFKKEFVENIVNKNDRVWRMSQFSKQDTYLQRAYSCADGHFRIMESFLNSDYDYCLVLEDDALLPDDLIERLNYVIDNFIYDGYHFGTWAFRNKYLKNDYTFVNKLPSLCPNVECKSTLAYCVNKKLALEYYKLLTPISAPSDVTLIQVKGIVNINNMNILFDLDQKNSLIGK